jgi:hypothetical protein
LSRPKPTRVVEPTEGEEEEDILQYLAWGFSLSRIIILVAILVLNVINYLPVKKIRPAKNKLVLNLLRA